ncbi:hypothetical protein PIB30_083163 [Stylosanthes scabra]|uniref:Uncharacterized protein n=1 Tax=Stylosanthes scabra TaxID=79078 RepID=A0ABU6TRP8_9FABA|nr:hypothetical protein [Stylosanthes scabra]
MGYDDRTGFFFWGMVHGSESVDPLRRIGEATDQSSVLSGLGHCQTELAGDGILTGHIELHSKPQSECPLISFSMANHTISQLNSNTRHFGQSSF